MNSPVRFVLLCLLLCLPSSVFAQIRMAVAHLESGTVDLKYDHTSALRPLSSRPTTLWGGSTLVGTPEGGRVKIYWTHRAPETVTLKSPDTRVIPAATDPRYVVLESNLGELMGRAGLPKGTGALLFLPAKGARLIPDRPVKLRWEPTPPGRQFVVEVTTERGEPVWRGSFPGPVGTATSDELAARLREARERGASRFFITPRLEGGEPSDEATPCALLPADRLADLNRQLDLCATAATGATRELLRAAVFKKFGVIDAALEALDLALRDAALAAQPDLLLALAALHEHCGDLAAAATARSRISTLASTPPP